MVLTFSIADDWPSINNSLHQREVPVWDFAWPIVAYLPRACLLPIDSGSEPKMAGKKSQSKHGRLELEKMGGYYSLRRASAGCAGLVDDSDYDAQARDTRLCL